jgi:hypothetical protein
MRYSKELVATLIGQYSLMQSQPNVIILKSLQAGDPHEKYFLAKDFFC